jgi:SAM-dependent methyltransferase
MQMAFTGERYVPEMRGQIYYEHLHRYALALSLASGKDVLDVASGEGYGTALLATVARSVVGVDIDAPSVAFAASRYISMNMAFKRGTAIDLPLADASVDLVVSFETIEHLAEHERMLGEFKRVLRRNGHTIISSPNKLVYSDARGYSNPFHVRELYFNEFRDLLRAFFPESRIFGQRIFAGSAVHPLIGATEARWLGPSKTSESGITALTDPDYFVALCGAEIGADLPNLASVYLDPCDDLLNDIRSEERNVGAMSVTGATSNSALPATTVAVSPALTAGFDSVSNPVDLRVEHEQLKGELAQARAQIEALASRATEAERLCETSKSDLAEASLQVLTLTSRSASAEAALEPLRLELASTRESSARASAELRREQGNAEHTALHLAAAHAELATTHAELAATHAELAASTERERRLAAEAQEVRKLLDSIVTSRSWRMTLPLRLLGLAARVRRA